jgi:SAM-dependent methyltransferase
VAAARRAADDLLSHPLLLPRANATCPVCGFTRVAVLRYGGFRDVATGAALKLREIHAGHEKYRCLDCDHLFTTWFPALDDFSEIYSRIYDDDQQLAPNARRPHQEALIRKLVAKRGASGSYLDFGCGGNFSIAFDLRREGLSVSACDIHKDYPYDNDVLLRFDPSRDDEGRFDGISSLDAIEHVQDIAATWRYFNRALKPGGLMVHSFPTAFRYGYRHFFSRIPFHACLFSHRSLSLWTRRLGFEYLGPEPLPGSDVPECYWFRKIGAAVGV